MQNLSILMFQVVPCSNTMSFWPSISSPSRDFRWISTQAIRWLITCTIYVDLKTATYHGNGSSEHNWMLNNTDGWNVICPALYCVSVSFDTVSLSLCTIRLDRNAYTVSNATDRPHNARLIPFHPSVSFNLYSCVNEPLPFYVAVFMQIIMHFIKWNYNLFLKIWSTGEWHPTTQFSKSC